MSIVKPFQALLPARDKVHLVASRPVDFYSKAQLQSKLAENPFTFLHIVKPDFGLEKRYKSGSPAQLRLIREKFENFVHQGFLQQDPVKAFYIYRQIQPEGSFTGIIACASVDEYLDGTIKKHELTLSKKEEKLKNYLGVCDFNAEPVSLTYPAHPVIDDLTVHYLENIAPVFDFTTTDRNRHQLWRIYDPADVILIEKSFAEIPSIYIADGHHRSASSARLALERRAKGNWDGTEGFNYFMGIYFPDHQLKIFEYNRVVSDLGGINDKEFLSRLKNNFEIVALPAPAIPEALHEFTLLLDGEWYALKAKEELFKGKDPAAGLDAAILSDAILTPLLKISDLRNDDRVGFIPGTKGIAGLQRMVERRKLKAGFVLHPVTMDQLRKVADAGLTMPPKSTWIEPKLRNGLVVYSLREEIKA